MSMLKTFAQRLSRGKIIKRRLPEKFGKLPLYVSPDARLQHIRIGGKGFEQELLRIVSQEIQADSIVWDNTLAIPKEKLGGKNSSMRR